MKRTSHLLIFLLSVLTFTACKKQDKNQVFKNKIDSDQNSVAVHNQDEDAMAEDKKLPLTSLAVSESDFNFGNIKKGSHVEHTYVITNTGDQPLIISTVRPGCGCTVPDYTKAPILPKQKGKVTLKFDSSAFEGLQNKYAEVYTNTEKSPVVLTFTANVQVK
ncbi:DUF1573 domain-containing protein [Elizabethkingia argentiflava]|uniref:DUF1573 domain-containing protein n=1 Tax=Elizabethkingia argenteiflava TaxID=2681556 RepID=A0A845PST2_9FLAO|nr:DUF1573 domain-containing protein [Elizabethkingia argenteiflava]NAW51282.1 DUF1573 domain-containing protein [Elizabethkingia argenteiflava]